MAQSPDRTATNQATWVAVQEFIRRFPNDATWGLWRRNVLALLDEAIDAGLDKHFRAGQSMQHIILSTASEHGLESIEPPPPRVTIAFAEDKGLLVALSRANIWFASAERTSEIPEIGGLQVLAGYLKQLWEQTRPEESMPLALRSITDSQAAP